MRKRPAAPPMSGGSSLLVIFAVLCLTVFALLTLSTVRADSRLADAGVQAVADYYAADAAAEALYARLRQGEVPDGVTRAGETYTYVCPISKTQELVVSLRKSGETWTVEQWQAVSTVVWQPEDSMPVWDGDLEGEVQ